MRKITKSEFKAIATKYLSSIPGFNDFLDYLETTHFYEDPASYKYHSSYAGGLINHSFLVTQNLIKLSKIFNIKWERPESPYLIGLFHDLCKANTYEVQMRNVKDETTGLWHKEPYYSPVDNEPLGHGSKSVIILQRYMKLTKQEEYCIYHHMGSFCEPSLQYGYSAACVVWPEIMIVALADQMAGVMEDREEKDLGEFPLLF